MHTLPTHHTRLSSPLPNPPLLLQFPRHTPRRPHSIPALPHIPPHVVITRVVLVVNAVLVLGAADTLEVARFVGPGSALASMHGRSEGEEKKRDGERKGVRKLYRPILGSRSLPSLSGISRLSPAPEAPEA